MGTKWSVFEVVFSFETPNKCNLISFFFVPKTFEDEFPNEWKKISTFNKLRHFSKKKNRSLFQYFMGISVLFGWSRSSSCGILFSFFLFINRNLHVLVNMRYLYVLFIYLFFTCLFNQLKCEFTYCIPFHRWILKCANFMLIYYISNKLFTWISLHI